MAINGAHLLDQIENGIHTSHLPKASVIILNLQRFLPRHLTLIYLQRTVQEWDNLTLAICKFTTDTWQYNNFTLSSLNCPSSSWDSCIPTTCPAAPRSVDSSYGSDNLTKYSVISQTSSHKSDNLTKRPAICRSTTSSHGSDIFTQSSVKCTTSSDGLHV